MRHRFILSLIACLIMAVGIGRIANPWLRSVSGRWESAVADKGNAPSGEARASPTASQPETACQLPLEPKSVRFAVIGDSGTGKTEQYQVAQQMERCREITGFDFVLMLGDNIYGGKSQLDFERKFELPYKPLLDADVKFYASIGNHDNPNERLYAPFNMGGARYYSFKKGNATFFALDSNYMDSSQLSWLERQLQSTSTPWKICYFHHPLYSDGRFHGPDKDLRAVLTPLFVKYGVNVALSGHDHVYERIKPENGTYYFVVGNSGELRYHNLKPSAEMAAGFDTDRDFMLAEIAGDKFYFQTITRTGQVVDSGILQRPTAPSPGSEAAVQKY
jgi:3',5'-cyclic AMP phosphodiesterase CpdA